MIYTAKAQYRYVVAMALRVCVIMVALAAPSMLLAKLMAPHETASWPSVIELVCGVLLFCLPFFLALFSAFYGFERNKTWTFSPAGIEMKKAGTLFLSISWEEVSCVILARFTAGVRVRNKRCRYFLNFVNRGSLIEYIPEEKRRVVSQL